LYVLENFVLVHNLNTMFVRLLGDILAHACEVRVHNGWCSRMSNVAGTALSVDLQSIRGHGCISAPERELHVCGKNS
jgi:hypothetical protein